ncbi:Heterokaryon incompatibility protein (HET) domain containing protein [Rhypophila sp. PSN 637]
MPAREQRRRTQTPDSTGDVSDPERPFLQERHTLPRSRPNTQYVALSYCWGQGKKFRTLRDKYEIFKATGIPSFDLPQTFKDAIHAAHSLGYRYIWIDALCIIQDDDGDLENELKNMGDIYRYTELTICAQGAASSHAGFFQSSRHTLSLVPCSVDLRIVSTSRETTVLNPTLTGRFNVKDYISSRGWILQEDILTLRALKFSDQMSWRCMETIQMETEPHVSRSFSRHNAAWFNDSTAGLPSIIEDPFKIFRGALYSQEHRGTDHVPEPATHTEYSSQDQAICSPDPLRDIFASWYSMIQLYSDMELTYASDVLRALSGVSAIFRDTYRTTYLAGLWNEDLFAGLCWYVSANDTRSVAISVQGGGGGVSDPPANTSSVAFRHTAPSWTWASVGKVRVRFACLSTRGPYSKFMRKPRENSRHILEAFCSWDDPINYKRPLLASSSGAERVSGQLWTLRMKTRVKKAILRRSEIYTEWRRKAFAAGDAQHANFGRLKPPPRIYARFPAQLLDFEDRTVFFGEAACDSDFESTPTSNHANHNQLVKWHATSTLGETRWTDLEHQDLEVMCLLLDAYQFWPGWYDMCLIALPRAKGSNSFTRIGLGFLPRGENHQDGVGSGWDEMDCDIF